MHKRFTFLKFFSLSIFLLLLNNGFSQKIVELNGKYGILGEDNTIVAGNFDSIVEDAKTFDDENPFFMFYKNGMQAVVFKNNLSTFDKESSFSFYDEISPSRCYGSTAISFIVRNKDHYGVVEENGVFMVPLIYDSIYQTTVGSKILIVKSGNKYDFLDLVLDADTKKELSFPYDQVYPETERAGYTNLRIGNKYGFYFNGMDGNYYKRGFVEVKYDSLVKANNYLLSSWSGDTLCYFYMTNRLPGHGNFRESEIYFAEYTRFIDVQSKENLIHEGLNRNEQVLFIYPMLYIDFKNEDGFYYYDLSESVRISYFEPRESTTYSYEVLELRNHDIYHPDTLFVHLFRVKEYHGFTPIQSFYTVAYPGLIFTAELEENQTIRFEQYSKNAEYARILTVSTVPNSKGKFRTYVMNGYLSGWSGRVQANKPPAASSSFSGNSGGGKSGGWMDFLWIGGR
jgi:hypothetical protein